MKRQRYSAEYQAEAVQLVLGRGLSVKHAALDLGVGVSTLDKWVRVARERHATGSTLVPADVVELKRLQRENRVLREERDILKKAAAYFARTVPHGTRS